MGLGSWRLGVEGVLAGQVLWPIGFGVASGVLVELRAFWGLVVVQDSKPKNEEQTLKGPAQPQHARRP